MMDSKPHERFTGLFSTAYFAPISYYREVVKYRSIYIDKYENYLKQTFRNRCVICSANGPLALSIPVVKTSGNHTPVKDIHIDYSKPWQRTHLRAMESAYRCSPFFEHYHDELKRLYEQKFDLLLDFNTCLNVFITRCLKCDFELMFTENYIKNSEGIIDFRNSFTKRSIKNIEMPRYFQVFENKFGFIPDLSIIDLLFNEGKHSLAYIKSIA